ESDMKEPDFGGWGVRTGRTGGLCPDWSSVPPGCVSVFSSRFRPVLSPKTWTAAQRYCREQFADFAIIKDETDGREVKALLNQGKFWMGLKYTWRWSQGGQEQGLLKWARGEPGNGVCATVSPQGWGSKACRSRHQVLCYSGDA
uniref:C-type lectin domain-containing protein n=1 Tax=Labrus bergylta TaxID=56723 RepID=A0A3Q3F1S6_9LABR